MLFKEFLEKQSQASRKVYFTLLGDVSKNGVITDVHDDFVEIVDEDSEDVCFPFDSIVYIEI